MRSKSKKLSKAKADKYFSLYIRTRDANKGLISCCTCGRLIPIKEADCGHFLSRRFEATRYDERNANGQCKKCNRFEYGNQYEHGLYVDDKFGKGTADNLLLKARMLCKRNQYDYEAIAEEFKNKLVKLQS